MKEGREGGKEEGRQKERKSAISLDRFYKLKSLCNESHL